MVPTSCLVIPSVRSAYLLIVGDRFASWSSNFATISCVSAANSMNKRLRECSSEEGDSTSQQHKRLRAFPRPSVTGYALYVPSEDVFCSRVEPLIRSTVRATVEEAVSTFIKSRSRMSLSQLYEEDARQLQLKFRSKLPHTLYAGSPIKADDNSPVQVVLVDPFKNEIVEYGSLSSMKVQIVVMDGDFCRDGKEDWSEEEFNTNVVRARDGKPDLLKGDLVIKLSNGVGQLGDISFTDNSSWIRSKSFKLGARALDNSCKVREALTGAFPVKDHRGELYKKHHPPSLDDEVWRLENIAKDGVFHKKLKENGIHTVEGFRQRLFENKASLRSILGRGMANKSWEETVKHALEACSVDKDNTEELACKSWNDIYGLHSTPLCVPDHILQLPNSVGHCVLDMHEGPISELQKEPSQSAETTNMQGCYMVHCPYSSVDELLPMTAGEIPYNVPISNYDLSIYDYGISDTVVPNKAGCCPFSQPSDPLWAPEYVPQAPSSPSSWVTLLTTIKCGRKFLAAKRKATVPLFGC